MSAQGKCPKCGSPQKDIHFKPCVISPYTWNPHPWHSAPPAEPATQTINSADVTLSPIRFVCGHGTFAEPCKICQGTFHNSVFDPIVAAPEASPQEAREFVLKFWEANGRAAIQFSELVEMCEAYAAHEHKLRVEAEQELRAIKQTVRYGRLQPLKQAFTRELRRAEAAESRLAQIEQERRTK